MTVFVLKSGVACTALKEVYIGSVQIFELLLQHLRVCFFEPGQILFKLRQQKCCGSIGKAFAGLFKSLLTSVKPVVENETRMPELYGQLLLLLLLIRVDTVFICATYFHNFINSTFYPFCLRKTENHDFAF